MRTLLLLFLVGLLLGCGSSVAEPAEEEAKEAAAAYADESLGIATGGVWLETGSTATDVVVSRDGVCAAVLVEFEPDTLSFVVVLASLDRFTLQEVLQTHAHGRSFNVDAVAELVDGRRWAPTFDVPFGGQDVTLGPYRQDTAVFDSSCETIHLP